MWMDVCIAKHCGMYMKHLSNVYVLQGVEDLPVPLRFELVTSIPVEDMEDVESISQLQEVDTPDDDEGTCTYLNVIL